jgi:hypothetical protein
MDASRMLDYVSQRRNGFKGGIQANTTAASVRSKKLDKGLGEAVPIVMEILAEEYPEISVRGKFNPSEVGGGACQPDGGLWFYNGALIAAFEAKYQGRGGNAIERWIKNYDVVRKKGPGSTYVTFASGAGTELGAPIDRFFRQRFWLDDRITQYNEICPSRMTVFIQEADYEMDFIIRTMVECIEKTIKALDD